MTKLKRGKMKFVRHEGSSNSDFYLCVNARFDEASVEQADVSLALEVPRKRVPGGG